MNLFAHNFSVSVVFLFSSYLAYVDFEIFFFTFPLLLKLVFIIYPWLAWNSCRSRCPQTHRNLPSSSLLTCTTIPGLLRYLHVCLFNLHGCFACIFVYMCVQRPQAIRGPLELQTGVRYHVGAGKLSPGLSKSFSNKTEYIWLLERLIDAQYL